MRTPGAGQIQTLSQIRSSLPAGTTFVVAPSASSSSGQASVITLAQPNVNSLVRTAIPGTNSPLAGPKLYVNAQTALQLATSGKSSPSPGQKILLNAQTGIQQVVSGTSSPLPGQKIVLSSQTGVQRGTSSPLTGQKILLNAPTGVQQVAGQKLVLNAQTGVQQTATVPKIIQNQNLVVHTRRPNDCLIPTGKIVLAQSASGTVPVLLTGGVGGVPVGSFIMGGIPGRTLLAANTPTLQRTMNTVTLNSQPVSSVVTTTAPAPRFLIIQKEQNVPDSEIRDAG
jgi:hypothetical protein